MELVLKSLSNTQKAGIWSPIILIEALKAGDLFIFVEKYDVIVHSPFRVIKHQMTGKLFMVHKDDCIPRQGVLNIPDEWKIPPGPKKDHKEAKKSLIKRPL